MGDFIKWDELTSLAKELRPFLVNVANSVIENVMGNKILLYHPGSILRSFDVTSAGLTAALAAAVSGDTVMLPAGVTISGEHTLGAGVVVSVMGGQATLTGTLWLGAGSSVLGVVVTVSSTGAQVAVYGPTSGTAYMRACSLSATSSDGGAIGLRMQDGAVNVYDTQIVATGATSGYGVLGGVGDCYIYGDEPISGSTIDIQQATSITAGNFPFTLGLEGWDIWRATNNGAPLSTALASWDGSDGRPGPGSGPGSIATVHTNPGFNATRDAGVALHLPGLVVSTGDAVSAWFRADAAAGATNRAYVQINFSDGTTTYDSISPTVDGNWYQVGVTLGAGDDGKVLLSIWVYTESGATDTSSWHIDDISISFTYVAGHIYTNGVQADRIFAVPLQGDRGAYDAESYASLHANDIDTADGIHHTLGSTSVTAAPGDHDHGTRTENVLVAQGAAGNALKDSHIKDGMSGAYLLNLLVALTGNRDITLQDANMILAALNIAQVWTANQGVGINTAWGVGTPYLQGMVGYDGDGFPVFSLERINGSTKTNNRWSFYIGSNGALVFRNDTNSNNWITVDATGNFVGFGNNNTPLYPIDAKRVEPSVTNAPITMMRLSANVTGTPSAGFGPEILLSGESSTTVDQEMATISSVWTTVTHASRTVKMMFSLVANATKAVYMTLYPTYLDHVHCYGSMYQDDTGTNIAVGATNTDYIVTGMSGGAENEMTFQNTQEIKCLVAGTYKVDWSISFTTESANQEVEATVGINGTRQANASAHRRINTATDEGNMGATGIVDLAVNDLVQIVVRNETSTADIIIGHANLSIERLGG